MKLCKTVGFNVKKIISIFYFGFFLLQSICFLPQQSDVLFETGNQFFEQERYTQACGTYQSIENKGFVVLYNIALSYLNRGNLSQATVYGKRAEKQASFCELAQIYELFDCIKRQIDSNYELSWHDKFIIFLKKIMLSLLSLLFIQICLLVSLVLLIILWHKRLYRTNVAIFSFLAFFCILSLYFYKINLLQQQVGVVIKESTSMLSGPDELFYKKLELHDSDELVIVDKQNRYYQVKTKRDLGWVYERDIELV